MGISPGVMNVLKLVECTVAKRMNERILVTGVSGPIGAALLPLLKARGYRIVRLVRHTASREGEIRWNPSEPLQANSVSGFEAVIHLAGESVVGRWTAAKKKQILESRVFGTKNLCAALAGASQKPRVFVSASAIGYYGDRGEEILSERSPSGQGFLPEVCRQWEAATKAASEAGIRAVSVRIGILLSAGGGALHKMLTPFRFGLGGRMGNGRQWWSWIHVQDLVGAIHHILKSDLLEGPVNGVGPHPVTNAEFTSTLASVLARPAIFPMPAIAARLVFGQMADELLLASQRVEPAKLVGSGYPFQFTDLRHALVDLLH
jgi:uncharacterized protein (TIGR01777 family)